MTVGVSPLSFVVPAVAPDLDESPDRLGRAEDARAIGALIVSRQLKPPLAIGLFGAWGSGKTHFMNQIKASVKAFEDDASEDMCHRVVQIKFNAWHYAETNLWASLLQHIWASPSPAEGSGDKTLDAALAKVEGAKRVTDQAIAREARAGELLEVAQEGGLCHRSAKRCGEGGRRAQGQGRVGPAGRHDSRARRTIPRGQEKPGRSGDKLGLAVDLTDITDDPDVSRRGQEPGCYRLPVAAQTLVVLTAGAGSRLAARDQRTLRRAGLARPRSLALVGLSSCRLRTGPGDWRGRRGLGDQAC